MNKTILLLLATLTPLAISACTLLKRENTSPSTLKEAFEGRFAIGATIGKAMLQDDNHPSLLIAKQHFIALTAENAFKWAVINPSPGQYNFTAPDQFVGFGKNNGIQLVGHVLFWHSQTPDWVFEDLQGNPLDRDALLGRMRERAKMLATRYGDSIKVWDVVNEAINDDGSLRNSKFNQIIGDDFIEQAFRIAKDEFPKDSIFLYNDYSMTKPGRQSAVISMVNDFKARNIKIDGIGMQGHWSMETPTIIEIEKSLQAFSETQIPIHITELDLDYLGRSQFFGANVDIETLPATLENNPFPDGNFPPTADKRLAERYGQIFSALLKYSDNIERVTFWGINDSDSWLNDWPIKGRTNYPLLFNHNGQPKAALESLLKHVSQVLAPKEPSPIATH